MKFKPTILLAILNIVVFFFLFQQKSPFDLKVTEGEDDPGILPYALAEATTLEVKGLGLEQPYSLSRVENDWTLKTPIEWPANAFAVRRMISQLESTSAAVRFPVSDIEARNQSLEDFGLASPEFVIQIGFKNESFEIPFGAPVEIGDRLYMLSADKEEILVVDASVLRPFLVTIEELRASQLFSIPQFEIQSLLVEFNDDRSRRRFTKHEEGWSIDTPFLAPANEERVLSAIDRLVNSDFEIVGTSVEDQADLTNFNSFARFELLGNRRNSTLLIWPYMINGEVNTSFYQGRIEGSSTLFLIPTEGIDWWRNAQNRLRERQLFDFELGDVSKIEVVGLGEPAHGVRVLKLENQNWKIYSGDQRTSAVNYEADSGVVVDVLSRLRNMVALEFVTDNPNESELTAFGLTDTTVSIFVQSSKSERLLVGGTSEDGLGVYAKLEGSNSVYLVAKELIDLIHGDPLSYRQRYVPLVPGNATISHFEIEDLETNEVFSSKDGGLDNARQTLDKESKLALQASMNVLLREFSVSEFIDREFSEEGIVLPEESLSWQFRLKYFFEVEGELQSGEMLLTKRFSGTGQIAYIEDKNLIVNLSQNLIDVIHPIIFDPKIPEEHEYPDPEEIIVEDDSSVDDEDPENE